jgi:glycosyltransferase involved in cell wall biosynthesis
VRIAIDARYLGAEFTGIGVYSRHLLESLSRLDHENEYLVVTHASYRGALELADNFEVVTDSSRPVSLRTLCTMQRALAPFEADVLHSLFPLAPLLWRKKLVVMAYDLQPLLDPQFTGMRHPVLRSLYDLFYRFSYPACLRKADYVISTSYATKQDIKMLFPDVAEKVLVVHGGIAPEEISRPSPEEIERVREKYDLPRRFLFYLGSTRPNKNLMRMLEAFEEFSRRHPEHHDLHWVMVVSQDRFFDPVFARIRERNLLGRVRIHEQVSEAEKAVFFSQAELLYYVTKWEGFGLPVLEAQGIGLPVLASTHASLPEVCGTAALMADPDDTDSIVEALEKFYADPGLRRVMIERGLENVKRFNWDKVAREVLALYTHLLA